MFIVCKNTMYNLEVSTAEAHSLAETSLEYAAQGAPLSAPCSKHWPCTGLQCTGSDLYSRCYDCFVRQPSPSWLFIFQSSAGAPAGYRALDLWVSDQTRYHWATSPAASYSYSPFSFSQLIQSGLTVKSFQSVNTVRTYSKVL